jgi:signal transduction histidine kinase
LVLGMTTPIAVAWVLTWRALRQAVQPTHRNKLTHWLTSLACTVIGCFLFFFGDGTAGSVITLLTVPAAAYVILAKRLRDVRDSARWALCSLITAILSVAIYAGGFLGAQYAFRALPGYEPLLPGTLMALALALIFRPMHSMVQRWGHRLIPVGRYDPGGVVKAYSANISNIIDLERLAEAIVRTLNETMAVEHSVLLMVHAKEDEAGSTYAMDSISLPKNQSIHGTLAQDSPIARFLHNERRPLTQHAIDLLPRFQTMPAKGHSWLSGMGLDVYAPIHARGEWIGLLALGPKISRDPYFDEDLDLLDILTGETAAALETARIVDELEQAGTTLQHAYAAQSIKVREMTQAYRTLETALERSQEKDSIQSGFISAIAHRVHVPFANLNFSLQLIEHYGLDQWTTDQREQLAQIREGIGQTKQMIDDIVTLATLFSEDGQLGVKELDAADLVQTAVRSLRPMVKSKHLDLQTQITPSLPTIRGDRERLVDAIYHLIQNAIQFTGAGGTVWIRCWAETDSLQFEVQDTGDGVPASRLDTLWDSLPQEPAPGSPNVEGFGLGLVLVRLVVRAHSGKVYARSQEGVGSTFGFHIPLDSDRTARFSNGL